MSEIPWWSHFFDKDYLLVWGSTTPPERSDEEAKGLWEVLQLSPGDRVLDAPCGYGRLSWRLASLGAHVLGVDQSQDLLDYAERNRGKISVERLRFLKHDLRNRMKESGFDAAVNIFSSLGYGSEEDDVAILTTLCKALRRGGQLFIETNHRDAVSAFLAKGCFPALRLSDGTLVIEEPQFDPLSGRIDTTWFWSGPNGSGFKRASLRVYSATELVQLTEQAGLRFVSAHRGCSSELFEPGGPELGGRLGILARRH